VRLIFSPPPKIIFRKIAVASHGFFHATARARARARACVQILLFFGYFLKNSKKIQKKIGGFRYIPM